MMAFSLSTIASGVEAGAKKAYQGDTSKSCQPSSAMVGTSGNSADRLALETAKAFSLPASISFLAETTLSNSIVTRPATTSSSAGAMPL